MDPDQPANKAKGIFKPKQMSAALSIKTTVPRAGRSPWYGDQDLAAPGLDHPTGLLRYDLARGNDPTNDALRTAWRRGAHLIYLQGVAPAVYQPVFPVWIADFRSAERYVLLATADFLEPGQQPPQPAAAVGESVEVSYATTTARTRNHQAWFSARTKAAYACAATPTAGCWRR